jgi:hypothetical protein
MASSLKAAVEGFLDGMRRVAAAPALVAGVFALTFLMAVPPAALIRSSFASHLGDSLEAASAADAVNPGWWYEFRAQATGLGTTFTPAIIGFAALLDHTSDVMDAAAPAAPLAWLLGAYLVAWTFALGGLLDRFARRRAVRARGFFAACGGLFFRMLRLAAVASIAYWLLFSYVHPWVFEDLYRSVTLDLDSERAAFGWRLACYALFGALLLMINVLMDYAKVRLAVEDRRSVLGAITAAWRFLWHRPGPVAILYLLDAAVFLAIVALWFVAAPDVGGGTLQGLAWRFLLGQAYVLARLLVKLQFLASQTALFQASLAHAAYTAAPAATWPPSPAVESIPDRTAP